MPIENPEPVLTAPPSESWLQAPRYSPSSPKRIFISYSHGESALVEQLASVIRKVEVGEFEAVWDANFSYGQGFHEQIKLFIEHAHAFMPIITPQSSRRGWVHQEIGYAQAFNVPVIPISVGRNALPGQMLERQQALRLLPNQSLPETESSFSGVATASGEEFSGIVRWSGELIEKAIREFAEKFNRFAVQRLIDERADARSAWYRNAAYPEDRALQLAEASRETVLLAGSGYHLYRQKGGFSSLSVPDSVVSDPIWEERWSVGERTPYHRSLLRQERIWLEHHARKAGCHLIVYLDILYVPNEGAEGTVKGPRRFRSTARLTRLETLRDFLMRMSAHSEICGLVRIAVSDRSTEPHNQILIGNWFLAESITADPGKGYRNTLFTRHAPSIEARIRDFDQELNALIGRSLGVDDAASRVSNEASVQYALRRIDEAIAEERALEIRQHSGTVSGMKGAENQAPALSVSSDPAPHARTAPRSKRSDRGRRSK